MGEMTCLGFALKVSGKPKCWEKGRGGGGGGAEKNEMSQGLKLGRRGKEIYTSGPRSALS